MTLTRGTPPCTPHMEVPPPGLQGIVEVGGQTENAIKHSINAGDETNDAKDETVASIFENKFCILFAFINFEILETGLPLYQYGLGSRLTYELTFADYSDAIKSANTDASYTISNISLEFDTVTNALIISQIRTEYMKSSILYDRILRSRIIPLSNSDTSLLIVRRKVLRVCYSFLQKKEVQQNSIQILKNFSIPR